MLSFSITFFFFFNVFVWEEKRLFGETIPKVYFGNMHKGIPDLNNIDIQSIAHPAEGLVPPTGMGYLAVWTDEFNPVQDLPLSLPSSNTCSCHCPGADLTWGY